MSRESQNLPQPKETAAPEHVDVKALREATGNMLKYLSDGRVASRLSRHRANLLPETHVVRVVGKTSDEGREMLLAGHRENILEYHSVKETHERGKTPEEVVMLTYAEEKVNKLRERHGLPAITLPPERIKMIEQEFLAQRPTLVQETSGGVVAVVTGGHSTIEQKQFIAEYPKGAARFNTIQHELLHAGSYEAIQYHDDTKNIGDYRTGLSVTSRKPDISGNYSYFLSPLSEAVTEENTRRITLAIPEDDPGLGNLAKRRKENYQDMKNLHADYPDQVQDPEALGGDFLDCDIRRKDQSFSFIFYTSGFPAERKAMWDLFDKIHEENPAAFPGKSREEAREAMFQMVTKAMLTGNILPFGRLMNDTFGRGTFRNYGHCQTAQEIESFLSALGEQ